MKISWRRKVKWLFIVPVVVVLSFGFVSLKDKEFDIVKNLEIFYSIFTELDRFYVDETNPEQLIESAIDGMLTSLDPYTTYIPEEEAEDFRFMTTGEYGGIGAYIRKAGAYAIITEPYEGFPAHLAGLLAGDTIVAIDGESTRGKDISGVSDMLKGTPNTSLVVTVKRVGTNDLLDKTLKRKQIIIPNVPYYGLVDANVGYIRLAHFTSDAGKESREALAKLKEMGAESVILDLRGNPGGLLVESINVANLFVKKDQEIVSTIGKIKQWDGVYKTSENPVDTLIPLVVLVNSSSASASEIVAGSMQDLDRAVIIGQRTFGKGLVQTTRPIKYNSQLKVTTSKYYIPSGRCIQALDYSHRNEDGSVGQIPDSLISKFYTDNGRVVYDGGGIAPDIAIDAMEYSNIAASLYAKNLIFDFATLYVSAHEEIVQPEDFSLSDQEYSQFLTFIQNKEYDYTTESNNKLNELIKIAKEEKYYEIASTELTILEELLAHDKEKDLQTFKSEITELLEEEIVSRYYFQKGRIQHSLLEDQEIAAAVNLLKDQNEYATILSGPQGQNRNMAQTSR